MLAPNTWKDYRRLRRTAWAGFGAAMLALSSEAGKHRRGRKETNSDDVMTKRRRNGRILLIAAIAGVLVASPMTYIAAKEDPQREFDDDDGQLSRISLTLQVIAPCFVATWSVVVIGGAAFRWLDRN